VSEGHKAWGHASPSQINTYGDCPRKWYNEKILGMTAPRQPATEFGSLCHAALEHYLQVPDFHIYDVPFLTDDRDPRGSGLSMVDDFLDLIEESPPRDGKRFGDTYERVLGNIYRVIQPGFRHLPAPCSFDPAGIEARVDLIGPAGVPIMGYADLTFFDEPSVSTRFGGPRLQVWDHKTTGNANYAKLEGELPFNTQALIYGLWAMDKYGEDECRFKLIYYMTRGGAKSWPVWADLTREAVEATVAEMIWPVVSNMKATALLPLEAVPMVEKGSAVCNQYGGCAFKSSCFPAAPVERRFPVGLMDRVIAQTQKAEAAPETASGYTQAQYDADVEEALRLASQIKRTLTRTVYKDPETTAGILDDLPISPDDFSPWTADMTGRNTARDTVQEYKVLTGELAKLTAAAINPPDGPGEPDPEAPPEAPEDGALPEIEDLNKMAVTTQKDGLPSLNEALDMIYDHLDALHGGKVGTRHAPEALQEEPQRSAARSLNAGLKRALLTRLLYICKGFVEPGAAGEPEAEAESGEPEVESGEPEIESGEPAVEAPVLVAKRPAGVEGTTPGIVFVDCHPEKGNTVRLANCEPVLAARCTVARDCKQPVWELAGYGVAQAAAMVAAQFKADGLSRMPEHILASFQEPGSRELVAVLRSAGYVIVHPGGC
jgi:hypothetical protein